MFSLSTKPERSVFRILFLCLILMFSIVPIASAAAPDPVTNLQLTSNSPVTITWTNPTSDYDYIRVIKLNRTNLIEVFKKVLTKGTTIFWDHTNVDSNKQYWYIFQTVKNGVYSTQQKVILN
ncbi:hypothetical protein [Paenibacillus sp. UMB4589-SE434]|uniref:hypothetical protein n=1 Tax=Paenibacillus sp. UMB4589-SE434 TaxID=3046314 RepID=UPI00254F948F|nr:hypothetical protein [Paenibacillus sp. UMB4589-SE434]MDK8179952.1 hypothetical protein [Paenibacillus sp. UMB4589-SE434]